MTDPPQERAPVSGLATLPHTPLDLETRAAAERIVLQTFSAERSRRRAYWVALALMTALGLYLVVGDEVEIGGLWLLGGAASCHLVVHLWFGVRNRARLAMHASREVLDEDGLVAAARLMQNDGVSVETAVREVDKRRSLRGR